MNTQTVNSTRTITALFDKRADAMNAVEELVKDGIPRTSIRISPESESALTTSTKSYDTNRDEKGFWAALGDLFMPEEDRHTYAEAMHRGDIMVSVVVDDAHADLAEDILEQHGTVNVEEREAKWRKEGWAGYSVGRASRDSDTASLASGPGSSASTSSGLRTAPEGDQVIDEVAEQLRVGKRQVNSGRVKVRSYVVETPVSEAVSLRSETVHVERRPVDRVVGVGEDAFKERTIEAVATSEEAVVSKETRVTGEVIVRKTASDRTETINDKVRSTKVDVEDNSGSSQSSGLTPKRVA